MLLDIFSGFDDHCGTFGGMFYLVWVFVSGVSLLFTLLYWVKNSNFFVVMSFILSLVFDLGLRTQAKNMGGAFSMFSSLFIGLGVLNLSGLVPYVFSATSHLALNLAFSLPIWLSIVLLSITYDLGSFLSHLQPSGAPAPLNPFLCTVELLSLLIRPLTLAVRLTANLSTGHILMALLGSGFVKASSFVSVILLFLGVGYFLFEMAVCVIQSYIFTLLPTLYLDEHPSHG